MCCNWLKLCGGGEERRGEERFLIRAKTGKALRQKEMGRAGDGRRRDESDERVELEGCDD